VYRLRIAEFGLRIDRAALEGILMVNLGQDPDTIDI